MNNLFANLHASQVLAEVLPLQVILLLHQLIEPTFPAQLAAINYCVKQQVWDSLGEMDKFQPWPRKTFQK